MAENFKYEILEDESKIVEGIEVYRIRALVAIPGTGVKAGDRGGYVQSYDNLSQEGFCWVYDDSVVLESGLVTNNAKVVGTSRIGYGCMVKDNASVRNGQLYAGAVVKGRAICGGAMIGSCILDEDARLSGILEGNVYVKGTASIFGSLRGNVNVSGDITILSQVVLSASEGSTLTISGSETFGQTGKDLGISANPTVAPAVPEIPVTPPTTEENTEEV